MRLYDLVSEYKQIEEMLYESGGEITPEIESLLQVNKENLEEKLDNMAKVVANLEGDINACEGEIHRLASMKLSKELAIRSIKKAMLTALTNVTTPDKRGVHRVETSTFKLSTRKSEQVVITDLRALPSKYKTVTTSEAPDKNAIKIDLKEGKIIKGASLSTNLNLQIR
jgi:hypothetical protein